MRFINRTPVRTFILYPIITALWEFIISGRVLEFSPLYVLVIFWGYLPHPLCGRYRRHLGAGGPGLATPPELLVATGPYAYTRNPMYLGHIIFLIGLTLTLKSWLAAMITVGVAVWFHRRVLSDEKELAQTLGQPYIGYTRSVKRWIPGLL